MKKRVFLTFFAFMGIALAGCDLPFGGNKEEDKQQSGDNNNGNDNQNQGGDNQQGGDQQGNEGQGGEGGGENENFTITLNEESLDLFKGDTFQLVATTSEEAEITWSSSNPSFAEVDETGLVSAIEVGTATITATANGKSDTCEVEVSEKIIAKSSIELIRTYPLNTMSFDSLEEGQEFEEGSEIEIIMSVVPDFETRPFERYRIFAGSEQLETQRVEGEQKIKATYTVGEEDFSIFGYYSDFLPDEENGVNVNITNDPSEYKYLGFDASAKWGKPNGFIVLEPNYKISNMQWKYSDAEEWTTASTNTMAATFCGNAAQANPDYAQLYVFRVVKNNAREALEEDIDIKFNIEEIVTKSITYIGGNNPLLDLNNSNLPTSGVVGSKITIDVKPLDGSTKVEVASDDVTLTATYNAGQYQFDMPNQDVTISITCTEANIEVLWDRPVGVSSKLLGSDDPYSLPYSKVNAGETYYVYASVNIANHYVKAAYIGDQEFNFTKTYDKDENDNDYYKATVTIPADAEGSVTIRLVEEQQPLTITFEQRIKYGNKMIVDYEGNLQEGTIVTVGSDAEFTKPLTMTVLVNNEPSGILVEELNEYDEEEGKYAYLGSFAMPNSDVKLRFTEIEPGGSSFTISLF